MRNIIRPHVHYSRGVYQWMCPCGDNGATLSMHTAMTLARYHTAECRLLSWQNRQNYESALV